ncbi:MAG: hypothetical protein LC104_03085 [Bacteroidales bacterium]|nr:hypothetical protein [Bacteroidales bacterium]
MATSQTVTYKADPDEIWRAVVKLVTRAGYAIAQTNQAAKQIVYQASGGGWAWAQNVQVSITSVDDDETMVTVLAEAAGQATFTEGGQQRKLIVFVLDELDKMFERAVHQHQPVNAPGTSGCAGMMLLLSGAGITGLVVATQLVTG